MKEDQSVLGILMYLFHNYIDKDSQLDLNNMELIDELKSAGFPADIIGRAFRWLHHLTEFTAQNTYPTAQSFRVFSEEECLLLSEECRRFILSLETQGILTPQTREVVIHQALELANEGVDVPLIKWVTLMVLFNTPNCESALSHMEFLVLHNSLENVH